MLQNTSDEQIIDLFFCRSDEAVERLSEKYGGKMYAVSYNVLRNREDAEECVNDAYMGVWNAIPPARPLELCAFVCKIVRNIALAALRRRMAQKRDGGGVVCLEEIAECIPSEYSVSDAIEQQVLTDALNAWLLTLDRTNRYIFLRRYWYMDQVGEVASALGMSEGAVYLRIDRMKKKLCKYLAACDVII